MDGSRYNYIRKKDKHGGGGTEELICKKQIIIKIITVKNQHMLGYFTMCSSLFNDYFSTSKIFTLLDETDSSLLIMAWFVEHGYKNNFGVNQLPSHNW